MILRPRREGTSLRPAALFTEDEGGRDGDDEECAESGGPWTVATPKSVQRRTRRMRERSSEEGATSATSRTALEPPSLTTANFSPLAGARAVTRGGGTSPVRIVEETRARYASECSATDVSVLRDVCVVTGQRGAPASVNMRPDAFRATTALGSHAGDGATRPVRAPRNSLTAARGP
ncbi:hypothetical protein EAI_14835 [Harpegnathos saltator]|uniref:Uncharacterized protein n=1 Tax=Harpegnathos saltator TaxID=610380 RepID=E2C8A2_HARSA|nr:hypothetical protein EAI_14835 [Harpegnathos saltator]